MRKSRLSLEKPVVIKTSPSVEISIIDQFIMTDRASRTQPESFSVIRASFASHETARLTGCRVGPSELGSFGAFRGQALASFGSPLRPLLAPRLLKFPLTAKDRPLTRRGWLLSVNFLHGELVRASLFTTNGGFVSQNPRAGSTARCSDRGPEGLCCKVAENLFHAGTNNEAR